MVDKVKKLELDLDVDSIIEKLLQVRGKITIIHQKS